MAAKRNLFLGRLRLAALFVFLAWLVWAAESTPGAFLLGLGPVVVGESVRFWAAGHLLKSKELVTSGPYAYTQNPLYLGRLLIYTGFCLMAQLPYHLNLVVLVVGLGIFFLYYIPRKIRVEGERLAELHGAAWQAYFKEMPILFPRMAPYAERRAAPWRWGRMARNREYLMVLGVGGVSVYFAGKAWGWW